MGAVEGGFEGDGELAIVIGAVLSLAEVGFEEFLDRVEGGGLFGFGAGAV